MDESDNGLAMLERHLARAEQALMATAGGRLMCAIGRSGQSFPAARYHEGAVSALVEVRRAVRRRVGQKEAPNVALVADTALGAWRGRAAHLATANPDWRAYLAGGVEALEALVVDLDGG